MSECFFRRALLAGSAFILLLLLLPLAATAQEPPAGQEEGAKEKAAPSSKWSFFGYLTQAYAMSDGNQFLGIPEAGTADYRALAVQMRYQGDKNALVVQLSHERLGDSPLQQFKPEVALDWGFYQRNLGSRSSLRVGRVPIPLGIYNEIRDVGTLLPFFRPPIDVYGEVANASESMDGISLSHTLGDASGWGLEGDVYFGDWHFPQQTGAELGVARVHSGAGGQIWLTTPIQGLRVGAAGQKYTTRGGARRTPNQKEDQSVVSASVDGDFNRFTVRSEYRRINVPNADFSGYYAQLGVRLTSHLGLHLQKEGADLHRDGKSTLDIDDDDAAGLSYEFTPELVLKGEYHTNKGFRSEAPPAIRAPLKTKYGILSLSVAF
jgi:hypothetical protein